MGWVQGLCVTPSNGKCLMVPGRRTMLGAQVEREDGSLECTQLSPGCQLSLLPRLLGQARELNRDLSGVP